MSDNHAIDNKPAHFIRNRIREDINNGNNDGQVITRFPPEPNGYLHIGHAKSICLNFGMAEEFGGIARLRFDDTNPLKEEALFYERIQDDVRWLGFEWKELRHAADYFEQLYGFAVELIEKGLAYVDSLPAEQMREFRGTLTEAGKNSPDRDRSPIESLALFKRMRAGEFADGAYSLRAKIDMAAPNINLRDPIIYRIRHVEHQHTQDAWCIYPTYDFAHGLSDAIEGVTHSLCTLEFEDHRPLYDWFLDNVSAGCHPQQIEFARGNLDFTVLSKRRLRQLVEEGFVDDWDDPRMPTIAGIRRRGYPPQAVRKFWDSAGVTKSETIIPMGVLEGCVRDYLNEHAPRTMAVLRPLKVVLTNFPEGETRWLEAAKHPQNPAFGTRKIAMTREIYIEASDFLLEAPKKFFRLKPNGEVRLRNGMIIQCNDVIQDADGNITELHCTFDPESWSGMPGASRKVRGTIHWVSATHGVKATVRQYDRLFNVANPLADKSQDFKAFINPDSLTVIEGAVVEPDLLTLNVGDACQFERIGYFVLDQDTQAEKLVFNQTVGLRDTWAKISG